MKTKKIMTLQLTAKQAISLNELLTLVEDKPFHFSEIEIDLEALRALNEKINDKLVNG